MVPGSKMFSRDTVFDQIHFKNQALIRQSAHQWIKHTSKHWQMFRRLQIPTLTILDHITQFSIGFSLLVQKYIRHIYKLLNPWSTINEGCSLQVLVHEQLIAISSICNYDNIVVNSGQLLQNSNKILFFLQWNLAPILKTYLFIAIIHVHIFTYLDSLYNVDCKLIHLHRYQPYSLVWMAVKPREFHLLYFVWNAQISVFSRLVYMLSDTWT